jgi:hypothetical protein
MKRLTLFSALVLVVSLMSMAQKPGFFVKCTEALGDTAAKYTMNFERLVGNQISEAFHCATVNTQSSLNARLAWEKDYQMMGGESELNVCQYLKCDYLVTLHMIEANSSLLNVSATCINFRKKEVLAEAYKVFNTSMNYAGFASACTEVTSELIKELGKYEICAFQGPVAITISSDLDSTSVESYSVYCNQMDQQYRKETVIKNHTFSDWKLQRKGIPWTDGTMTFYTDEMTQTTEEDGCHKCKSGREGGLVTTMKSTLKVKGSGISHESEYQGKEQDDTRIELRFLENGTYLVIAKGTSKPVTGQDVIIMKAEGTCDSQPEQTKPVSREITVPLRAIFGPYPGKATDKFLQQKDEKKVKDPATREEQTITIDFSLKQKEN